MIKSRAKLRLTISASGGYARVVGGSKIEGVKLGGSVNFAGDG